MRAHGPLHDLHGRYGLFDFCCLSLPVVSTLLIVTSLGKESLSTPGPGFCSRATSRPATRGISACWARQGSCVPGTAQRGADTEEQTAPTDRAEAMCVPTSPPPSGSLRAVTSRRSAVGSVLPESAPSGPSQAAGPQSRGGLPTAAP